MDINKVVTRLGQIAIEERLSFCNFCYYPAHANFLRCTEEIGVISLFQVLAIFADLEKEVLRKL